jgi:hypothetical protein
MRNLLMSVVAAVGLACAGSTVRPEPGAAQVAAPGSELLYVGEHSVVGRTSSLKLEAAELHGRYRSVPVHLSWNGQFLQGSVAEQLTRVELAEGDDVRLAGSFAGSPLDLVVEQGGLSGRVGACHYALRRVPGGFRGPARCGSRQLEDAQLAFPPALAARPLGEQAALLALLLSPELPGHYLASQQLRPGASREEARPGQERPAPSNGLIYGPMVRRR